LGEEEKALYHFKQAGPEADPDVMSKAKVVLGHLKKCDEAKRLKDWHTVLKEAGNAITAGADSAPMVSTGVQISYFIHDAIGIAAFTSIKHQKQNCNSLQLFLPNNNVVFIYVKKGVCIAS